MRYGGQCAACDSNHVRPEPCNTRASDFRCPRCDACYQLKAGRTWSTALRLMERYPEYRFLASSPLQYEMVKESFPETFDGIRQRGKNRGVD